MDDDIQAILAFIYFNEMIPAAKRSQAQSSLISIDMGCCMQAVYIKLLRQGMGFAPDAEARRHAIADHCIQLSVLYALILQLRHQHTTAYIDAHYIWHQG